MQAAKEPMCGVWETPQEEKYQNTSHKQVPLAATAPTSTGMHLPISITNTKLSIRTCTHTPYLGFLCPFAELLLKEAFRKAAQKALQGSTKSLCEIYLD